MKTLLLVMIVMFATVTLTGCATRQERCQDQGKAGDAAYDDCVSSVATREAIGSAMGSILGGIR